MISIEEGDGENIGQVVMTMDPTVAGLLGWLVSRWAHVAPEDEQASAFMRGWNKYVGALPPL